MAWDGMENIADVVHPHTHFAHFAALWFGEGPLPRGRKRFASKGREARHGSNLISVVIIGRG